MILETKLTISKLEISADEWSLYDIENRDAAAGLMNAQIKQAINTLGTGNDAMNACYAVLKSHSKFGAADSEGVHKLEELFEKIRVS